MAEILTREDGWQPIETAPVDGMPILVTWPVSSGFECHVCYFCRDRWQVAYSGDAVPHAPSHWMPLPPAPDAARTALAGVTAPQEVDAK